MKGEHLFEDVKLKPNNPNTTMFSQKLHPIPHYSHQEQTPTPLQQHQQHHLSEEEESSGGATGGGGIDYGQPSAGVIASVSKRIKECHSSGGGVISGGCHGDGASIEISRRPRGRPPGSKNKPKPPIIITRESECAMRPHILEIVSGLDIIEAIARFARQRSVGLCVLTASGSVMNISLRQPSATPGATVTFHGRFEILSISATYLPPSSSPTGSLPATNGCTISLAGPQGQIFGGSVVGPLIAATNVFLIATSFTSPTYHRLPVEEEDQNNTSDNNNNQVGTPSTGQAIDSTPSDPAAAMTIYNCSHIPNEVIWTPNARPPSQHF
ncbi:hypothetical protein ACHQM5_016259 [Ranunculus cassubicifolius]